MAWHHPRTAVFSHASRPANHAQPRNERAREPRSFESGERTGRPKCTLRQAECLYWVQEGKSATDIGAILGLSPRTVEGHLARVCEQFGVRTRIQAVLKAKALGLLPKGPP